MSSEVTLLPFLGGGHQSGQFVTVEPHHGKLVEGQVDTGEEDDESGEESGDHIHLS